MITAGLALLSVVTAKAPEDEIRFTKVVIDSRFVAESAVVADINKDGKQDILAGNIWYQGPNWKAHEIAPYKSVDPKTAWSNCFNSWAADLNKDGWVDQIVIGMPGEKAVWRENPKDAPGPWKEHLIWRSAGNESPHYEDLFKNGKRVLIMGYDDAHLAWFEPDPKDAYALWIPHNISPLKGPGSHRYSHGLGIADLDLDGKNEIVTTGGYYVAPDDPKQPWHLQKVDLGPDCAHMVAVTIGATKRPHLLTTSAHARGVWQFRPTADGYERSTLDETISVTHSASLARLGPKRTMNLITGKRKWGHPPGVDVGSEEPHWIVRYELQSDGKWVRHMIDADSGVGTQITVIDVDGDKLLDIVTANKNGVFLFTQS